MAISTNKALFWFTIIICSALYALVAIHNVHAATYTVGGGGNFATVQALVESLGLVWEDIDGNPRDSTPTIGAYEFTSVQCDPADANCDGCISLQEISLYVGRWLNSEVSLQDVAAAVSQWLQGC